MSFPTPLEYEWNGARYPVLGKRAFKKREAARAGEMVEWLYGSDRAHRRHEENADLARWNSLRAIRGGQAA